MLPLLRQAVIVIAAGSLLALPMAPALSSENTSTTASAAAKKKPPISDRIDAAGEAVDSANAKVRKAMRTLARVRSQLPAAREQLRHATTRANAAEQAAAKAEAAAAAARAEMLRLATEQLTVKARIDRNAGRMGQLARAVYQQGPFAEIEVVLDSQSPGDAMSRLASVDAISRTQAGLQRELMTSKADLTMREVRLEALRVDAERDAQQAKDNADEAKAARADAARAKASVKRLIAKQKRSLKVAEDNRDDVIARLKELKAEQARIQAAAAKAAREEAARREAAGESPESPSGELTWPIPGGGVSAYVGPRTHPVYGYKSCHTGIDIRGATGTPVRAAHSGTVINNSSGGAYGNATLISGAGGLATFYAHLSRIDVNEGDRIKEGEVIGAVGTTGWVTGPHLHFEVHLSGTPYDPLGWFGQSKRSVGC
ncbi:MAG: murein hydrolase activator EnvC family protein [Actinomycetes bacterium]